MKATMEGWYSQLNRQKKTIVFCLLVTAMWGLLAHMYIFVHTSFSHDSMKEFNGEILGNAWKIQLGRVFIPIYRSVVRTSLTFPWLIGVLSLFYIGLAVFLVVKLFHIQSKFLVVLVSGVFAVNLTVLATFATYIHDSDSNMLALLCAVCAVFMWNRFRWGAVPGAVPICLCLGLYQSYISVAIVLILMVLVLDLLDHKGAARVFGKGLASVGMLAGGGVLYVIAMKIILALTHTTLASGGYNSLDTAATLSTSNLLGYIIEAYQQSVQSILYMDSPYPAKLIFGVNVVLAVLGGVLLIFRLVDRTLPMLDKCFLVALLVVMPLGMNISAVLAAGMSHDLMHYAVWLFHVLVLLLAWKLPLPGGKPDGNQVVKAIACALVFVLIWSTVQTANAMYVKKDLEYQEGLSFFTRVVTDMEDVEGYVPGETPVVFVGVPSRLKTVIPGFEPYQSIVGSVNYVIGPVARWRYEAYFMYFLRSPVVIAEDAVWSQMQRAEELSSMPAYPKEGSMQMVDGVLLVKLGD